MKIPRPSWSTRIRPPPRGTTEPEPGAEDVGGGGRRGVECVVAAQRHGPAQRVDPERQHVPAVLHEGLQQRAQRSGQPALGPRQHDRLVARQLRCRSVRQGDVGRQVIGQMSSVEVRDERRLVTEAGRQAVRQRAREPDRSRPPRACSGSRRRRRRPGFWPCHVSAGSTTSSFARRPEPVALASSGTAVRWAAERRESDVQPRPSAPAGASRAAGAQTLLPCPTRRPHADA